MAHATICYSGSIALESVTFPRISLHYCSRGISSAVRESIMIGLVRRRHNLRNAGVWPGVGVSSRQGVQAGRSRRFRDQAGGPDQGRGRGRSAKTSATLRTDADAAFRRNDFRTGLSVLGQIAATTPDDAGNWLRLAKAIFQITAKSSSEQTFLWERASTAAYLAYQRAAQSGRGGRCARRARQVARGTKAVAAGAGFAAAVARHARRSPTCAGQYEKLRDEHGFRLLDYTVDSDSASPRACFQFSEELAKRTDFAPFPGIGRAGQAGALGGSRAALCRRAEARRALQHQSARAACRPP